ncbi:MAG TPA: DUF885 family protein, partial [Actinomycetota bacterium]|nr:DUF885 family protein [Actinomycetota bacterium]
MTDAHAAARELADRYWEGLLELEPFLGTMIGDERFDDRLPDVSEGGRAARETYHRAALDELTLIDRDLDDEGLRTTLDMLEAIAARELASLEHRLDRLWAVSHLWGPGGLVGELASMQRVDSPERLDRYVARLDGSGAYYDAVLEIMRDGVAAGVTAPRIVVERAVAQVERLLATPPEDAPSVMPAGEDAAARERIAGVTRDALYPALERYLAALREY